MISIVICSINDELYNKLCKNIAKTIGCEHEVIKIENKENKYSLCSAYNLGVTKAKFDVICFMHEDIQFTEENWGDKVIKLLEDKAICLIGVAGSSVIKNNGVWIDAGQPYIKGQIIHEGPKEDLDQIEKYSESLEVQEVVVLDGVFMATRKEVCNKITFDEATFDGFHFYDIDFSLRVAMKYKVVVAPTIKIKHYSGGQFKKEYDIYRRKFIEKHKDILPFTKEREIKEGIKSWKMELIPKLKY